MQRFRNFPRCHDYQVLIECPFQLQTLFEILMTVWYMVNAYYFQLQLEIGFADINTRATWNGIADAIYIGVPCLLKCLIYVIVFLKLEAPPNTIPNIFVLGMGKATTFFLKIGSAHPIT